LRHVGGITFDYDTGWGFVNGEAALNAVPAAQSITTTKTAAHKKP